MVPAGEIPLGQARTASLPVIVGVSGYSRFIVARMIPSRQAHDILGGHLACLRDLGGVPRNGVYDNEAALGQPPQRPAGAHTAVPAVPGDVGDGGDRVQAR